MSSTKQVTAAVIVVGNEILSGRTQDLNLQFLAERLHALGIRLAEARVVRDTEPAIVEAVNVCRRRFDYVFTTGGIGPTHDDVTAACIARAFGVAVERNAEAERRLRAHFDPREVNDERLSMADMPQGATLIDNPVSAAPGFRIGNVFVMAGVPAIMRAMFEAVAPILVGGPPIVSRTVAAHLPEGTLAAGLRDLQERWRTIEIGSYPYFRRGRLGVSVVLRGTDATDLDAAADAVRALIRNLGGAPVDLGTE
ncbi:MAG: molybdopterin-binding protein [Nitrospirota bacterium]|jgi:molybdenum cofactor synthesis domain-containing protein